MAVTSLPHAQNDRFAMYRNGFALFAGDEVLAAKTWRVLAPLMAARRSTRLWSAETGQFHGFSRLETALPISPAAVPVYNRSGQTRMLALDLDAKILGASAVDTDYERITGWLNECGGQWLADLSASGGAHILVPLQTAVAADEIRPLLTALAAKCPTLDKTPMLNDRTGAISVPGSRCREGGFRVLVGDLAAGTSLFAHRNPPDVLAALTALVGADPSVGSNLSSADQQNAALEHDQLPADLLRYDALPNSVLEFAESGRLPTDNRWASRSEARLSVLVHVMWRGIRLAEVRRLMGPGQPWRGLAQAYNVRVQGKHHKVKVPRTDAERLLRRDWTTAHRWHQQRSTYLQTDTHKNKHTCPPDAPAACRHWLAHAVAWCDVTFRSSLLRWSVAAVLQALAVSAARTVKPGSPCMRVAMGGRSLSLAAGLLSESTVWATLRLLRDLDGSPVRLVAKGIGVEADTYELVTPAIVDPDPDATGRPTVDTVHDAWSILGWQHRRVYEMVTQCGLQKVADIAMAARVSTSSVYDSMAELCRVGLLSRGRGWVDVGETSLDDIAAQHRCGRLRSYRVRLYRGARQRWRQWLADRPLKSVLTAAREIPSNSVGLVDTLLGTAHEDYLAAVMDAGPPLEPGEECDVGDRGNIGQAA